MTQKLLRMQKLTEEEPKGSKIWIENVQGETDPREFLLLTRISEYPKLLKLRLLLLVVFVVLS